MRTIIAGGRDYVLKVKDAKFLDTLPITEVVSGGARGADAGGEKWARSRNIPIKSFPAQWTNFELPIVVKRFNKYGKPYNAAAGNCRNEQMAQYAEAVVLFPGGKGTENMYKQALKYKLTIYDKRGSDER